MSRVTQHKTRQALLGTGNILDPLVVPEKLELFDADGNPIHISGLSDLPEGGLTNQVLGKASDEAYDVEWKNAGEVYVQLDEPEAATVGAIWIRQEV